MSGSSSNRSARVYEWRQSFDDAHETPEQYSTALPTYDESEAEFRRTETSNGSAWQAKVKTAVRDPSQDPTNPEHLWMFIDQLLRVREVESSLQNSSRQASPPMEERPERVSPPLFDPSTVLTRHNLRAPSKEPQRAPIDTTTPGQAPSKLPQEWTKWAHKAQSTETKHSSLESGYRSDGSDTLVNEPSSSTKRPLSPISTTMLSSPTTGTTTFMTTTTTTDFVPQSPLVRCGGLLRHREGRVQKFNCTSCQLSQRCSEQTLNISHPDRPGKLIVLSQVKWRQYHVGHGRDCGGREKEACLLCRLCYREGIREEAFASHDLEYHLAECHSVEEIKEAYRKRR